jgi:hypothetical protein
LETDCFRYFALFSLLESFGSIWKLTAFATFCTVLTLKRQIAKSVSWSPALCHTQREFQICPRKCPVHNNMFCSTRSAPTALGQARRRVTSVTPVTSAAPARTVCRTFSGENLLSLRSNTSKARYMDQTKALERFTCASGAGIDYLCVYMRRFLGWCG